MTFDTLATFELTEKTARDIIEAKEIPMPDNTDFPFKEFCITFPANSLIRNTSLLNMRGSMNFDNFPFSIYTVLEHDDMVISLYAQKDLLVKFNFTNSKRTTIIDSYYKDEKFNQSLIVPSLLLIQGVISYYLSPTTIIKKDEVRESRATSALKDYKSPSKKYIYKTRYVFAGKKPIQVEPRAFTRHTDAWLVNGHVRRYRDGDGNVIKEVYIKPYKKGTEKIKKQEYKITRI